MRNLLLLLLVIIGYLYLRRALRDAAGHGGGRRADSPPAAEAERMVACAQCGVHVPESEAVFDGEVPYCSIEHRRLGPRG
ncbi:MAG: hypothetical protein HGA47_07815 [Zoogloea sp.]|nr:hypothetical protein [Zoogloea sp.]